MFATPEKLADLQERIEEHVTAERLAHSLEINKGLISRALGDGYVAPALARAMGWPVEVTAVCPNPNCDGDNHSFDCRTQIVKPKPKPRPKRKRRPRISIHKENAASAARSIENLTSSDFRQELVRILSGE